MPRFQEAIRRWGHRMRHLGTLFHATDIPPCYRCGLGTRCKVGGLWHMADHDEEKLHNYKITPEKFKRWEDCPRTVENVARYARLLAELPGGSSEAQPGA